MSSVSRIAFTLYFSSSLQKMFKVFLLLFFLIKVGFIKANKVDVNCYNGNLISSIELMPTANDFELFIDGVLQPSSMVNSIYNITIDDDSINISVEFLTIKKAKLIVFKGAESCLFKLKPTSPSLSQRVLEQTITIKPNYCYLQITNSLLLDSYVAGVVEAEVGVKQPLEYYKVQSTICRTYVLAHMRKHEREGYNMCDKEHCQVFKGKSMGNIDIVNAVNETSNSVLVDGNLNLIVSAFHSNCGGYTVSSADVWNKAQSYFVPKRDTFCINSRNAHWEKEIDRTVWINYVKKKLPSLDSSELPKSFNFAQPHRIRDLELKNVKIPLKDVRADFNFKSTFFSIEDAGEVLIFKGKGFGHGIGLCQEGAIRMAKTGYSYSEIIHYYFNDVNIINLNMLSFFKDFD